MGGEGGRGQTGREIADFNLPALRYAISQERGGRRPSYDVGFSNNFFYRLTSLSFVTIIPCCISPK
jgi:hypothetical protein